MSMEKTENLPVANRIYHVDKTGTSFDYVEMECPNCNECMLIRGAKEGDKPIRYASAEFNEVFSWGPGDIYDCSTCDIKFKVIPWYNWKAEDYWG